MARTGLNERRGDRGSEISKGNVMWTDGEEGRKRGGLDVIESDMKRDEGDRLKWKSRTRVTLVK